MRDAFRSGDVWLANSRRYGDVKQALVSIEATHTTARLAVPYPESTEPIGGGAGKRHYMDGDGTVPADVGWMAPLAGLLPVRGAAHEVAEGSK